MKMKSASVFRVLALLALSTINSQLSTAYAQPVLSFAAIKHVRELMPTG
jgi:hypothetical protein